MYGIQSNGIILSTGHHDIIVLLAIGLGGGFGGGFGFGGGGGWSNGVRRNGVAIIFVVLIVAIIIIITTTPTTTMNLHTTILIFVIMNTGDSLMIRYVKEANISHDGCNENRRSLVIII